MRVPQSGLQNPVDRRDHEDCQKRRRQKAEKNEIANPWKFGSDKITIAPIIAAMAVSRMGMNRIAPASIRISTGVLPAGSAWRRRCCTTAVAEDSHRESMRLDLLHEQGIARPLPHHELVQLHCIALQARVSADPLPGNACVHA